MNYTINQRLNEMFKDQMKCMYNSAGILSIFLNLKFYFVAPVKEFKYIILSYSFKTNLHHLCK